MWRESGIIAEAECHDLCTGFHKYHALGNDYIVIDPDKAKINATLKLMSNRHTTVGSDGVLFGPPFDSGPIRLRIFNPEVRICGILPMT